MFDFDMLGLAPSLMAALKKLGLTQPTPIQGRAIPLALEGHDILGLAQTGTGKTLAFGLPMIDHLLAQGGRPLPKSVKALILAPTRELVNQIAESLRNLTAGSALRVNVVVGGQSIGKQIAMMTRGCDILVATPGRLIDLMDRGAIDLSSTRHLVLDEADQMLDMGFIHALRRIAPALGTPRQTMLFSATMPKAMEELAAAYLTNPHRVQVAPPGQAAEKITQSVHFVTKSDKPALLREMLRRDHAGLTLVFARTKHGAEKLMKGLVADGFSAASIHGNKSQGQRDRALRAFRSGETQILVATDVAARGIDIPGVAYVINFDLPDAPENYVHRIGRTARAGRSGQAITLCAPDEMDLLRDVEKVLKAQLPVAEGSPARPEDAAGGPRRGAPNRGAGPRRGQGGAQAKPRQPGANTEGAPHAAAAPKPKRHRPRRAKAQGQGHAHAGGKAAHGAPAPRAAKAKGPRR